ncbi:hypothetical protein ACT3TY_16760 [Halomonas sp. AOP22-C1-8]|uniref:hypothetical protein n=1 Tax=Halomonas sp. AOP22-C1-8 TaxID=3457717 RepID=UPI004033287D
MTAPQGNTSSKKVILTIVAIAVAVLSGWYLQPWYHDSEDSPAVLVTIFSVLAGFLVAVMAIVANGSTRRGRNWRQDTYYLKLLRKEMRRHKVTFFIFIIVLALTFLTTISSSWHVNAQKIVEILALSFATLGLIDSFRLANILGNSQLESLEHEIRVRRDKETGETKPDQNS